MELRQYPLPQEFVGNHITPRVMSSHRMRDAGGHAAKTTYEDVAVSGAGKRVWLLASGGQDGVAALGDTVEAGCEAAHIVGWVLFTAVITYSSYAAWKADFGLHCVDEDSPYAFWER